MASDVARHVRAQTRDEFVERFAGLYLLFSVDPGEQPNWGFETAVGRVKDAGKGRARRMQAVPIAKAADNPYADRISVGRTANCDIVIRHPSVSKLHAHFVQDETGRLRMIDQHSSNGTMVNGTAALPGESELIEQGDVIQFGEIRTTVLDAAGVYDALQRAL